MCMTPNELAEVMNEVNEKHGWNKIYTNIHENRKVVKYVDVCFDTRDGQFWAVTIKFREISGSSLPNDTKFDSICFSEEKCNKENILKWLNDTGVTDEEFQKAKDGK